MRDDTTSTISYPYRPKPRVMVRVCLFFGLLAGFTGWLALVDARQPHPAGAGGGVGHIAAYGSGVLYWIITGLLSVNVLIGLAGIVAGFVSRHRVTLTATDITAPRRSFSRKVSTVKLADVTRTDTQTIQKQLLLNIHYAGGKLTIAESLMPNKADFAALDAALTARLVAAER